MCTTTLINLFNWGRLTVSEVSFIISMAESIVESREIGWGIHTDVLIDRQGEREGQGEGRGGKSDLKLKLELNTHT